MRPLGELLSDEPAWPLVQAWLSAATNDVRLLPARRVNGERTLHLLQITTRAPLGAVALETGGVLADRGWLRLLGAGGLNSMEAWWAGTDLIGCSRARQALGPSRASAPSQSQIEH